VDQISFKPIFPIPEPTPEQIAKRLEAKGLFIPPIVPFIPPPKKS